MQAPEHEYMGAKEHGRVGVLKHWSVGRWAAWQRNIATGESGSDGQLKGGKNTKAKLDTEITLWNLQPYFKVEFL